MPLTLTPYQTNTILNESQMSTKPVILLVGDSESIINHRMHITTSWFSRTLSQTNGINVKEVWPDPTHHIVTLLEISKYEEYDRIKQHEIFKKISCVVLCHVKTVDEPFPSVGYPECDQWCDKSSLFLSESVPFLCIGAPSFYNTDPKTDNFILCKYHKRGMLYNGRDRYTPEIIHKGDAIGPIIQKLINFDGSNCHKVHPINQLASQQPLSTIQTTEQISNQSTNDNVIMTKPSPLIHIPVDDIRKRGMIKRLESIVTIMEDKCHLFRCRIQWNGIKKESIKSTITSCLVQNDITVTDIDDEGFTIHWDKSKINTEKTANETCLLKIPTNEIRTKGMIKRLNDITAMMNNNCELFCYRVYWIGIEGKITKDELVSQLNLNDVTVTDIDDDGFMIHWG